ncbi:periostin, osteoblast specific factor b isoform X2 [Betta splendens]|uniref:Periostin, osteoblast specific factor b isoform X2 n=1 Tax=Betta splendens TaxID=158456 RepID=A0A6P7PF70_BETSP|nr:periostin, osteoblast specific factor b isoform X2 [Betta splendens]
MKLCLVAAVALLVFPAFSSAESSAYDKIVAHSRIRARKEGPNVCALQQVSGTKKKYFSTCRNWYQKKICGKDATVIHECCPGYTKLGEMRGCPAVAPIDHVYNTLGMVKATATQRYADISKLRPEIEGSGSYTFFAPSNEAWQSLDEETRNALVSNVNIELYNALHYHMVNQRLMTRDLKNNKKFTSMYNELELHINHYPNGVVTVNCARVIYGNQIATNGVVHVIDRVISSVGNTIQNVLEVDEDLSTFMDMAESTGLMDMLGEPGHYTLFAPTNEAFDSLGGDVLERLQSDKKVLKDLLKFHLLESVQCSEAILAGSSYVTMEGNNIEIGCDGDSLTVNGIKMVLKKDIVTTNGVIHLIDRVLMPDSAKLVMELMGSEQSTFTDMVSELGLSGSMRSDAEYTLLAPLNSAFTDEVMSMDQEMQRIMMENHILKTKVTLGQLYNGQLLTTIGGKVLRVFIYRAAVCIENSCLIRGSKEASNGALHLTKTFLKPAEKNMFEILKANGGFKIFLSLMEAAGLTDLLKQAGDYTLFAPSDMAFAGLSTRDLETFKKDVQALKTILLYHFTYGIFIGDGLEPRVTTLFRSIQGSNLKVTAANKTMQVNSVLVPEADKMATNGVVHFVNHLLYPEDIPTGNQELLTLLKRIISYMQIKYITGFRYEDIPLTSFIKRVTHVIETPPTIKKVTRVIEGQPTIKKVTRVIEGEPSINTVTRVIEGQPTIKKVTRVIEGDRRRGRN